jgi:hypothetical protein
MLCSSFEKQYEMGLISWPRNFSKHQKVLMPCSRIANIAIRAERDIYDTFSIGPSKVMGLDVNTGRYNISIGSGLFSGLEFKKGQRVIDFKEGDKVSIAVYDQRVAAGEGGYALHINMCDVMDLYALRNSCKASMANDPTNTWNTVTNDKSKANCQLRVFNKNMKSSFYLLAKTKISPGDEILFEYSHKKGEQSSYIFPNT